MWCHEPMMLNNFLYQMALPWHASACFAITDGLHYGKYVWTQESDAAAFDAYDACHCFSIGMCKVYIYEFI